MTWRNRFPWFTIDGNARVINRRRYYILGLCIDTYAPRNDLTGLIFYLFFCDIPTWGRKIYVDVTRVPLHMIIYCLYVCIRLLAIYLIRLQRTKIRLWQSRESDFVGLSASALLWYHTFCNIGIIQYDQVLHAQCHIRQYYYYSDTVNSMHTCTH